MTEYRVGGKCSTALKEVELNEEASAGGKPTYVEPPIKTESPGHRVSDTSHVPLCDIAMLCDVASALQAYYADQSCSAKTPYYTRSPCYAID